MAKHVGYGRFTHIRLAISGVCVLVLLGASGCGGGGSAPDINNNNGGGGSGSGGGNGGGGGGGLTNPSFSIVGGSTTDIAGAPLVGADITLGQMSTVSSQFGAYVLPNVEVPAGQTSLVDHISARSTVNGRAYSGSNTVEVLRDEPRTTNVHIVMSPVAFQGTISGQVRDDQGRPLVGARVFASAPDPKGGPFFSNSGSFAAYTDLSGRYTLPNVPALNVDTTVAPPPGGVTGSAYNVTASYAGHVNQSQGIRVSTGQTAEADFTLNGQTTGPVLPVVSNFQAFSVTTPLSPTRAAGHGLTKGAMNAIRGWILRRKNLLTRTRKFASAGKLTLLTAGHRSTPAGSIIESDLLWDYRQLDTLLGYSVLRSDNTDANFKSIALLRDTLADRFSDIDPALTPDLSYYYSLSRLDTINFPANGTEGDPGDVVVVRPLQPISGLNPGDTSGQSGAPNFAWSAVPRATLYQILVYDQFPDYQSDTNPDGLPPIWPSDAANPGASLVHAPSTTQTYAGPALQRGHTYYWAVLASDSVGSAYSVSQIYSFTVN